MRRLYHVIAITHGRCRMPTGTLSITRYVASRGPYDTETIVRPSWDQIESALRALDRDLHPFVWMYRSEDADPEDELPEFEVLGGRGEYFVGFRDGDIQLRFDDPTRGDQQVDVWESDQGASIPAHSLCPDLELVITAAREFHETGTALRGFPWTTY